MKKALNVVVVGATGNVGRDIINTLAERNFNIKRLDAVASENSIGKEVSFGEHEVLKVQSLKDYNFQDCDIAFFTSGGKLSKEYCKKVAQMGVLVIDCSSYFRMDRDVPLIIPEINPETIEGHKNLLSTPNCAATQILMAIAPLHKHTKIKRVVASTYQSVSGAGKAAMDELFAQSKSVFTYSPLESKVFHKQIAFNLIPHIGEFTSDGSTDEEIKIINEIQKILDPQIAVSVTCVRVPVFVGHSVSMNIEFENAMSVKRARDLLAKFLGVIVCDNVEDYVYMTPKEAMNYDDVYVSRIRADNSVPHGLSMWVVSDNLKKGAALNAVQIAELYYEKYL
jgi:aspartate-semialdehyde dehydrogenase